jgi:ABC-type amino acid transport substrate-binding protein
MTRPYQYVHIVIVGKQGLRIDNLAAFKKLRIGVYGLQAVTLIQRYGSTARAYSRLGRILSDLFAGRIDAVVTDGSTASEIVRGNYPIPLHAVAQFHDSPFANVLLTRPNSSLAMLIDEAISNLVVAGSIQKLQNRLYPALAAPVLHGTGP